MASLLEIVVLKWRLACGFAVSYHAGRNGENIVTSLEFIVLRLGRHAYNVAPLVKDLTISISRHMNTVKSLLLSLCLLTPIHGQHSDAHTHTQADCIPHVGGSDEAK